MHASEHGRASYAVFLRVRMGVCGDCTARVNTGMRCGIANTPSCAEHVPLVSAGSCAREMATVGATRVGEHVLRTVPVRVCVLSVMYVCAESVPLVCSSLRGVSVRN